MTPMRQLEKAATEKEPQEVRVIQPADLKDSADMSL